MLATRKGSKDCSARGQKWLEKWLKSQIYLCKSSGLLRNVRQRSRISRLPIARKAGLSGALLRDVRVMVHLQAFAIPSTRTGLSFKRCNAVSYS